MNQSKTIVQFLSRLDEARLAHIRAGLGDRDVDLRQPPGDSRDALLAALPEADVLVGWGSDPDILDAAKNARLLINPGTGVKQHIEHFRNLPPGRDLTLANGHGNSYAVAQHTVGLLLALANQTIPHHNRMKAGEPRKAAPITTTYFQGITVGLLGYGAIGSKVHRLLQGFDIEFAACRRAWDDEPTDGLTAYTPDQLDDFFAACDVVVNSLPATTATRSMVTMQQLKKLGEQGLFVCVGRAMTVEQQDLYEALRDGVIRGAAMDVWWGRDKNRDPNAPRNDPFQFPFHELDNLVMSPHRAADSGGNLERWDEVIDNICRVADGRTDYRNVVDIEHEY